MKWLLRINGVLAVMAVPAVVMPHSWLVWCVARVDPDLPVTALVSYLARLLSAYYVLLGVLLLLFAADVRHYARAIRLVAIWCCAACVGLLAAALPFLSYLAGQWFFWCVAADGLYGLALAVTILLLQRRIARRDALYCRSNREAEACR